MMQYVLLDKASFFDDEYLNCLAKETLDVYSPLAHRLGMFKLKSELENKSLYILEKEKYIYIQNSLKQREEERLKAVEEMKNQLTNLLNENNIEFYSIKGRPKQIYSIYNKMEKKKLAFDELYDLLALRIITNTEFNCYEILG